MTGKFKAVLITVGCGLTLCFLISRFLGNPARVQAQSYPTNLVAPAGGSFNVTLGTPSAPILIGNIPLHVAIDNLPFTPIQPLPPLPPSPPSPVAITSDQTTLFVVLGNTLYAIRKSNLKTIAKKDLQ
jgi:hypothetical protein